MMIECQITAEDYADFFVYRQKEETEKARQRQVRSGWKPLTGWMWWLTVIVFIVVFVAVTLWSEGLLFLFLFGLLAGAGITLLLVYWFLRRYLGKSGVSKWVPRMFEGGRNIGVFGPHRYALTSETLVETSEGRERRIEWRAIEKIVTTDQQAFIYDTPISALVIPKRDFATEEGFWEFVRLARKYHGSDTALGSLPATPTGFPIVPRT